MLVLPGSLAAVPAQAWEPVQPSLEAMKSCVVLTDWCGVLQDAC